MQSSIVIFGASGDLTSRKLIPALYSLHCKKRLPEKLRVIGVSRTPYSHDQWREALTTSTKEFVGDEFNAATWQEFSQRIYYVPGDISRLEDFENLRSSLEDLEDNQPATRVYYLATAPQFYEQAIANLGAAGMAAERNEEVRRIVIEKPFGIDLETARKLNRAAHEVFSEDQIYRIDHYLGKETVQNLLVLRFANTIFEPLWNRNYIDHVQITVAEEVAVGRRGSFYDHAGVIRDMFQNHLFQLLMFTAMEAPVRYSASAVRNEKVKVLQAIRPMSEVDVARDTLRGQYAGYLDEPGVAPDSKTATYAAMKLSIDNWRWQGVPFYLRSGKAMSCRTSQIVIQFREPPYMLFSSASQATGANRLVIQVQPAEGIQLHFQTKVPDAGMRLRMTDLDFSFQREFNSRLPEAYQRLLLDTLTGDASLFARADEVELAWSIVDPILSTWQSSAQPELKIYEPGLWGPNEAIDWISQDGKEWFDSCPVLG